MSSSTFYTRLQGFKTSGDRTSMETEALNYIEGSGGYTGNFIQSISNLPFPLNIFPQLYNDIYNEDIVVVDDIKVRLQVHTEEVAIVAEDGDIIEEIETEVDVEVEIKEEIITSYVPTPVPLPTADQIQQIWENVFALSIIEGFEPYKLDQLIKILIVNNIVNYLDNPPVDLNNNWLQKLIHASVVLPAAVFPLPSYSKVQNDPMFTGSIIPYAIGDLQMVQHRLAKYEYGEIAQIQNVLSGELKKNLHRKNELVKDSSVNTDDKETVLTGENHGDMLEKQVLTTINDAVTNVYDYTDLKQSYGPPTTGTFSGKVTKTKTRALTQQDPVEFARKVLSSSISKLSKKISEIRERLIRNETEEATVNVIDNRTGNKNIRGIYYWLNKVFDVRLVNYGHRFMVEFIVQKPAMGELDGIEWLLPPVAPEFLPQPILSYKEITIDNYIQLGNYYHLHSLPFPPAANKLINAQLNGNELCSVQMFIPDGYLPEQLTASYQMGSQGTLITGAKQVTLTTQSTQVTVQDPLNIFTSPPVEVSADGLVLPVLIDMPAVIASPPPSPPVPPTIPAFYLSISVSCKCADHTMDVWKQQVYEQIQKAYHAELEKYEERVAERYRTNPKAIDKLVQKLVKKACKTVLWKQHVTINGTPSPPLSPPEDVVNMPSYQQFFEEVFEWDKMVYSLENELSVSAKEDFLEQLETRIYNNKFEKYIKSQQVRVIIPVKDDYHYKLLYYLTAGLVYYGEDHLAPVFFTDQSLAVKLKKVFELSADPEIKTLDSWQVKVPTEMQWLQESNELPVFKTDTI